MSTASLESAASLPQLLTHINLDRFFVKVWGVVDKAKLDFVRKLIAIHTPNLHKGFGQISNLAELIPGKVVLAFYDSQFQFAKIVQLDSSQTRKVIVNFIDLGVVTSVDVNDIRIGVGDYMLHTVPTNGLAEDYILHGTVAKRQWTEKEAESVNSVLKRADIKYNLIGIVENKRIIEVSIPVKSQSKLSRITLSTFLVRLGLADQIPEDVFTDLLRSKYDKTNIAAKNSFTLPTPNIFSVPVPSSVAKSDKNLIGNSSTSTTYINPTDTSQTSPPTCQQISVPKPVQRVQSIPTVQSYIHPTLPVDSIHDVVISNFEDGMNAFAVQLKKSKDCDLPKLLAKIGSMRTEPITDLIGLGDLCLARFRQDSIVLCRAVVAELLTDGASVLFVDFGCIKTVPYYEIYQIPPELLQEPSMALRFGIAGLTRALSTPEAHAAFTNIVLQEKCIFKLKVVKPLVSTQQRCELFIDDNGRMINVKNKILGRAELMKPVKYQKLAFKKNHVADVTVTYTESLSRFFVQLELNQTMLEVITKCVEDCCINSENSDILFPEEIVRNMAVCTPCPHKDNKYYRGLIANEPNNSGNVTVFLVDFGNYVIVHYSKLRLMKPEIVSHFPMQAVKCRLDMDIRLVTNKEVTNKFIELANDNIFKMSVKDILPGDLLLVDLVDQNGLNVANHLKGNFCATSHLADSAAPSSPDSLVASPILPKLQDSSITNWRLNNSSTMESGVSSFINKISDSSQNRTNQNYNNTWRFNLHSNQDDNTVSFSKRRFNDNFRNRSPMIKNRSIDGGFFRRSKYFNDVRNKPRSPWKPYSRFSR